MDLTFQLSSGPSTIVWANRIPDSDLFTSTLKHGACPLSQTTAGDFSVGVFIFHVWLVVGREDNI